MAGFTVDDVGRILRECAGDPDSVDLGADIGALTFEEMGYDSLALLEMAARIQREFLVDIPDDVVGDLPTPGDVVGYVGPRLKAA